MCEMERKRLRRAYDVKVDAFAHMRTHGSELA